MVKINGTYNVDHNNNFGSRAGGGLWGKVFSLVMWIAIFVFHLIDLLAYVDDVFSWDEAGNLVWYSRYGRSLPAKQASFLRVLDLLNVPHDDEKQLWGPVLPIIGFVVDTEKMSITMPADAKADLVASIRLFAIAGKRFPLSHFQQLAGWINWALNVYPRLRPGLCVMYEKMAGKSKPSASLRVSKALCRELVWLANHMESSDGVFLMDSVEWPLTTADFVLYTDACMDGMGFWCPSLQVGFQCPTSAAIAPPPPVYIFYWEALTVLAAFSWLLSHLSHIPRRVVIHCDNTNSVNLFSSFRASSTYNPILITLVDLLEGHGTQLQVVHIPGADNSVADALSRFRNDIALSLAPGLTIGPFQPPLLSLGADLL